MRTQFEAHDMSQLLDASLDGAVRCEIHHGSQAGHTPNVDDGSRAAASDQALGHHLKKTATTLK